MRNNIFDRALDTLRIAAHTYAGTFHVVDVDTADAVAGWIRDGVPPASVPVWSGASEDTIWGCPGDNYAFRAWHDRAHIATGADFSPAGELETLTYQTAQLDTFMASAGTPYGVRLLARAILNAEIRGQVEYHTRWGDFPRNQAAFIRAYVACPLRALRRRW